MKKKEIQLNKQIDFYKSLLDNNEKEKSKMNQGNNLFYDFNMNPVTKEIHYSNNPKKFDNNKIQTNIQNSKSSNQIKNDNISLSKVQKCSFKTLNNP